MKRAITLKSPQRRATKDADPVNPPWTEAMLGPAVVRPGRRGKESARNGAKGRRI